jgi:quercetin dioxygenase-like cupin family protein
MRSKAILAIVLGFVGAFALVIGAAPRLAAQNSTDTENTPAVTPIELAPGFVGEVFAGAPSAVAPGQTIYVARFTIQPGSEIFPHGHPGTTVLAVESGSFGWTLVQGTAYVVRGAGSGGTEVETVTEPNTEVILEPGDAIYYEADVIHTARGAGDTPTVVLGSLVLTTGAPLLMTAEQMAEMEMEVTPAS